MRAIELLAPARNLECGLEAIRHGADAVYIGAPRFGARAAAGNSVEDIAQLVRFAHPFGVRIYVTINTLLYDDELPAVQTLIDELAAIHVDALIVQDPRIRPASLPPSSTNHSSSTIHSSSTNHSSSPSPLSSPDFPLSAKSVNGGKTAVPPAVFSPLPLHASTQMDNRSVADVQARQAAGYTQTVLARELSLEQIRAIHTAVPRMPLEVFIHGALCVSYSGRCYASEHCFGRSANRGECAQFCRLPFDLVDAQGRIVCDASGRQQRQRHLLSLRDLNRAEALEELMDAGVTSFKIEGRLKDTAYVKNITAYYRKRIDAILDRRADTYCRSSYGHSEVTFTPNPLRSFNRGFTDYFLHGRTHDLACHATPKAIGEPVGTVKEIRANWLTVAGTSTFAAGDGLCFFTPDGRLEGFRVNTIDSHGRLCVNDVSRLSALRPRTPLFRNQDQAFERILSRPTATRRRAVSWCLEDVPEGFRLTLTDDTGHAHTRTFNCTHERARTPQTDNLIRQLLRLGDTPFVTSEDAITIRFSDQWFIPASVLAQWRREMTEEILTQQPSPQERESTPLSLRGGKTEELSTLPEQVVGNASSPLMTCRYCLRHAIGQCLHEPGAVRGELSLRLSDGRTFPLFFDCKHCEMQVLRPRS